MTTLNERICESLAEFMRESYRLDVSEVVEWEDDTESDGYCDSCYYEYAVVKVKYIDNDFDKCTWTYRGSFADLINSL